MDKPIEIIKNYDNLKDTDITEKVVRVKILLINSNNEVLLGKSHNNYQFPGGHVEKGESLIDALNREVQEEVGINLNLKDANLFAVSIGYWKDHPDVGKNRKTEIYFYEVQTDEKPNLERTNYTADELDGNFSLEYIPLEKVEDVLKKNIDEDGNIRVIAKEMLEVLNIYKK